MPSVFGHIDGYPIGSTFQTRLELQRAGIHRFTQAGISGSANEAADAIVISGGYEDDEDKGFELWYTGEGANNPTTSSQVGDQKLSRGNIALLLSYEEGRPVRVIRGKNHGLYGPLKGYRYDGLYMVAEACEEIGKSGFTVYRFRLVATTESRYPPR